MDRVESPSPQELLDEITGSDAWLCLIWESAPDAMALSDPDGTVLMVNPAYCALYGYRHEEVIGNSSPAMPSSSISFRADGFRVKKQSGPASSRKRPAGCSIMPDTGATSGSRPTRTPPPFP